MKESERMAEKWIMKLGCQKSSERNGLGRENKPSEGKFASEKERENEKWNSLVEMVKNETGTGERKKKAIGRREQEDSL